MAAPLPIVPTPPLTYATIVAAYAKIGLTPIHHASFAAGGGACCPGAAVAVADGLSYVGSYFGWHHAFELRYGRTVLTGLILGVDGVVFSDLIPSNLAESAYRLGQEVRRAMDTGVLAHDIAVALAAAKEV